MDIAAFIWLVFLDLNYIEGPYLYTLKKNTLKRL